MNAARRRQWSTARRCRPRSCIRELYAGLRHRRDRSLPFSQEADRPKTEAALAASADQIGRARRLFPDPERFFGIDSRWRGEEKTWEIREKGRATARLFPRQIRTAELVLKRFHCNSEGRVIF